MRWEAREDVANWIAAGAIGPARSRAALEAAGGIVSVTDWRDFLARTLTWLAVVALAAALGFFIAANWGALGRFAKLALVEAVIVIAIAVVAWRGLDTLWGRASLLVAALAVGTLLAFVGQTYQTGADPYELFAVWTLAILPWTLVGRQPALWVLCVALADIAAWLYAELPVHWFGVFAGPRTALWSILGIHTIALIAWEIAILRGVSWLDARWAVRLLAIGAGAAATALAVEAIVDGQRGIRHAMPVAAYIVLLAGLYFAYRVRRLDLVVLAAGVLSAIVVVVALIAEAGVLDGSGGFLMTGLVIIALAGAGAHWLRRIAKETAR